MALSKGSKFVVVENAGRDDEYVRPKEFEGLDEAVMFLHRNYTRQDREELNVDVMLKLADGTLTTEF